MKGVLDAQIKETLSKMQDTQDFQKFW